MSYYNYFFGLSTWLQRIQTPWFIHEFYFHLWDVVFHKSIFLFKITHSSQSQSSTNFFFYWVLPFLLINSSHSPTHLEFLPPVSTLSSSSMSCSTHVTKPPSYLCDYNCSLSLRLLFPFLIIYLMFLVMTNCLLHLKPLFLLFPLMLNLQLSPRLLQFLSGKRLCLFVACPSEKWHLVFVLSTSW